MTKICLALVVAALCALPVPSLAGAKSAPYVDLTADFARFADETSQMEGAARVALFRERMNARFPGFYTPRDGVEPAKYDARVVKALSGFAALRPAYENVQREFPAAFAAGIEHFRKVFPDSTPNVPVYLLHSLGEMDGGMRTIDGKSYLIFGADVIARIHDARTITPFLDHELFHVENAKYFNADCDEVWCALWAEGLATYAAEVMNPGADDRQLLLTNPKPIRAATDAKWSDALCFTRAKLSSKESSDVEALFNGGEEAGQFPRRFGYYVGLRVIEEIGIEYGLPVLAKMEPARAKAALTAGLERQIKKAGGCT